MSSSEGKGGDRSCGAQAQAQGLASGGGRGPHSSPAWGPFPGAGAMPSGLDFCVVSMQHWTCWRSLRPELRASGADALGLSEPVSLCEMRGHSYLALSPLWGCCEEAVGLGRPRALASKVHFYYCVPRAQHRVGTHVALR